MSLPDVNRQDDLRKALGLEQTSPDSLRLNFFETTPVNKLLWKITPKNDMAISRISYNFGSFDLSANGYIQLIVSKVNNPNVWAIQQGNSQIIFDKMGGANAMVEGESLYLCPKVLKATQPFYIFVISNLPIGATGVVGKLLFDYVPLYK